MICDGGSSKGLEGLFGGNKHLGLHLTIVGGKNV